MAATVYLLLALLAAQVQEPTFTISGRVTDRDSGQPLPRARVSVFSGVNAGGIKKGPVRSTVTDANGIYELPGVPAGLFSILAQAPPHVLTHLPQMFGHDLPYSPSSIYYSFSRPVMVKDGDVRDVNIALVRAIAVEGRVLSDRGDPMAGISVSLTPLDRGAPEAPPARLTDDTGAFRLFGVLPGRYRVCASAPAAAPSQAAAPFRRSCYPQDDGVLDLSTSGASGVEIKLSRRKAAVVSGLATDAAGAPLDRGQIVFVERDTAARKSLPLERAAGGRFVVRNVEPGSYEVIATLLPDSPLDNRDRELGVVPVTVETADIENVAVRMRRPARLSGVVVFDEGSPEKIPEKMAVMFRLDVAPVAAAQPYITPMGGVKPDLTFELGGMHEAGRITMIGLPQGWVVRSVLYQDRDIANLPVVFETSTDPRAIEVHLTNRVAHLSGHATAADKQPVMVMLITADRTKWVSAGAVVATAVAKPDGSYSIGPVASGEYLALAASPQTMATEISRNPKASLERLSARAPRIFLGENDRQTLVLFMNER